MLTVGCVTVDCVTSLYMKPKHRSIFRREDMLRIVDRQLLRRCAALIDSLVRLDGQNSNAFSCWEEVCRLRTSA